MSICRNTRLAAAAIAVTTMATLSPAGQAAAGTPAAAQASPTSQARPAEKGGPAETADLRPGRIPQGAAAEPAVVEQIPDGRGGTQTYRSQRFTLSGARGMLLVELVTGAGVTAAPRAGAAASLERVGDGEVVREAHSENMRELRWRVSDNSVIAVVGTGSVAHGDLVAAAASLVRELRPSGPMEDRTPPQEDSDGNFTAAVVPDETNTNMRGSGSTYTDDWGSTDGANILICETCSPNRGNVVGVWQAILWADGTYYVSGSARYITNCDVDGVFGPATRSWTNMWQYDRNLSTDGKVGAQTWGTADNQLRLTAGGLVTYAGRNRTLYFKRDTYYDGRELGYTWSWNSSPYYYTGYSTIQMVISTTNCVRG